jgi:hypothetical protein
MDDEIYDVTAWSLPALYGVPSLQCTDATAVTGRTLDGAALRPGRLDNRDGRVAWVVPSGDQASLRLMTAALRERLVVRRAPMAFTLDGRRWPAGSLVLQAAENPADTAERLERLARATGAVVTGSATSWVTEGRSLGSSELARVAAPRIALAWDSPAGRNSAGATRFVLEQRYGWPVTVVRTPRLARADLSGFDVLILPDEEASYAATLGEAGAANIREFVRRGGTLVTMAGATRWAADPGNALLSTRRERAVQDIESTAPADADPVPGSRLADADALRAAVEPRERELLGTDGVLLRVVPQADHWLTAGLPAEMIVTQSGSDVFRPLTLDEGANAVRFAAPERLVAGGAVWEESRLQMAFKPVVMVEDLGRGRIVAFTVDPTWRGQMEGLDPLLLNAIFARP